jgi:hypothetical protein
MAKTTKEVLFIFSFESQRRRVFEALLDMIFVLIKVIGMKTKLKASGALDAMDAPTHMAKFALPSHGKNTQLFALWKS